MDHNLWYTKLNFKNNEIFDVSKYDFFGINTKNFKTCIVPPVEMQNFRSIRSETWAESKIE